MFQNPNWNIFREAMRYFPLDKALDKANITLFRIFRDFCNSHYVVQMIC